MSNVHRFPRPSGLSESELELIAELVDGALDDAGREAALRLLQESQAAYEVYADAVATLRGTGHDPVGAPNDASGAHTGAERAAPSPEIAGSPARAARSNGSGVAQALRNPAVRRSLVPLVAAAGLALLLVLRPGPPLAPELATELGLSTLALATEPAPGQSAAFEHPLGAVRGGTTPGSELGRAFRLGVRTMDAEAEMVAGLEERARASHRIALDLLGSLEAPPAVVVPFREYLAGLDTGQRTRVDEDIEAWLSGSGAGLRHYRFGKTAEALRLAIAGGGPEQIRAAARHMAETIPDDLPETTTDGLAALDELIRGGDVTVDARSSMAALLSAAMSATAR